MRKQIDDCESACMEAENEFYEASDKIEVQRYPLGVVIMGYDSRVLPIVVTLVRCIVCLVTVKGCY